MSGCTASRVELRALFAISEGVIIKTYKVYWVVQLSKHTFVHGVLIAILVMAVFPTPTVGQTLRFNSTQAVNNAKIQMQMCGGVMRKQIILWQSETNGCFISRGICTFWIVSDIDILEAGCIGFVGLFNHKHQDLQLDGGYRILVTVDQQYPKTANGRIGVKKVLLVSGINTEAIRVRVGCLGGNMYIVHSAAVVWFLVLALGERFSFGSDRSQTVPNPKPIIILSIVYMYKLWRLYAWESHFMLVRDIGEPTPGYTWTPGSHNLAQGK
ncbi:hypothetical protein BDR06DRAFT_966811 [Suillus hirtellus]|nr:hypothetical protein BDR06DRAFT_966811 [Suillus hirtellus]